MGFLVVFLHGVILNFVFIHSFHCRPPISLPSLLSDLFSPRSPHFSFLTTLQYSFFKKVYVFFHIWIHISKRFLLMAHAFNPSTQEADTAAGGSLWVQVHPRLHGAFQAVRAPDSEALSQKEGEEDVLPPNWCCDFLEGGRVSESFPLQSPGLVLTI